MQASALPSGSAARVLTPPARAIVWILVLALQPRRCVGPSIAACPPLNKRAYPTAPAVPLFCRGRGHPRSVGDRAGYPRYRGSTRPREETTKDDISGRCG